MLKVLLTIIMLNLGTIFEMKFMKEENSKVVPQISRTVSFHNLITHHSVLQTICIYVCVCVMCVYIYIYIYI
jgi:hypothetical protein